MEDRGWKIVILFSILFSLFSILKLIGPSDIGTDYDDWLNRAPADRDEFIFQSSDKRIWDGTLAADGTQHPGTQMRQIGPTVHRTQCRSTP